MTETFVNIMVAVNDNNGNFTGRCTRIQIDDVINVESEIGLPCEIKPSANIAKIGICLLTIQTWTPYVGNIFWDSIQVRIGDAERLLNLLIWEKWDLLEAELSIWEKWELGEIKVSDLEKILID
ncbi:hypothetical protein [Kamptonema sp. UHCC 0994]|uniref:hypothetical protein n=1 Tax=Kamptonema sp. UHCC 0994 TaxID=3031329 RepID=UPI0023B9D6BB|nr:hypothetical protein [Kamptonema sp. UHCC 0994]MDF0554891.1 hypothetical protein [Kamptonema sp. UHCC 0994]